MKKMTKADLKTGMIIEYRNGDLGVVMLGCFCKERGFDNVILDKEGYMSLDNYNDDLMCVDEGTGKLNMMDDLDREYDIMKVYQADFWGCIGRILNRSDRDNKILIWERQKPREMTKAQIEQELGYLITII